MKVVYKFIILLIIYALLAIPDNKSSFQIPNADSKIITSKWWGKFAQNLVKFRITNNQYQTFYYAKHKRLLTKELDELQLELTEPDNPILDSINYHINKLAALTSLLPTKINEFEMDVTTWRNLLKYQSRYWDTSSNLAKERLFKGIVESRLALESALIQSKSKLTYLATVKAVKNLHSVLIDKMQIISGDLIVFNLAANNDPYVFFIKELPNAYKHIGSVYIKDTVATISYVDHIKGLTQVPLTQFIGKLAPNGIILRLRKDIPAVINNPKLPMNAATTIYTMASALNKAYDFNFNLEDHKYLYDWELISMVYEAQNLKLNPIQILDSKQVIQLGAIHSKVSPFEIEFNPEFVLAGEWYNTQLLYENRLLTVATTAILDTKSNLYFVDPALLPIYRIIKGYSMIIGQFGFKELIPNGVTAQTQLVYDRLAKEQKKVVSKLEVELSAFEFKQHHRATYLKMLQKASEITAK